jgi:trehalose 6-phosphate synthase/phosphatase
MIIPSRVFMDRILIVSNRLPIQIHKRNSALQIQPTTGGLATGVNSIHKLGNSLWIGWPGIYLNQNQVEEREQIVDLLSNEKYHPVFLTPHEIKYYYEGFSNNTIWPLFHYFNLYATYDLKNWETYQKVNQKFCDEVIKVAKPNDTIWIHDYQLMLLPQMVRAQLPDAKIGYFHHIPFPSHEIFRLLPWREEILEGLLGANLIGFHTYDYVFHFLSCVRRILGNENYLGEIQIGSRQIKVDIFPMGIDYQRFSDAGKSPLVQKEMAHMLRKIGKRKIILSFDRLDYTKGIPLRLEAFAALLERKPEYRGKVSFILVAVPSRINVRQYQTLKKQIDELVGRINGKYGTTDWAPVSYFSRFLPFETLIALYGVADVGLVTPIRDGMNLMAKEFIATKINGLGALILSEMTGAAQELGEAIIVNPNDQEDIIEALETALAMPVDEQIKRNRIMQKRLSRYNVERWADDFLNRLSEAYIKQQDSAQQIMTLANRTELVESYSKSKKRLILLDYDGTLVPFATKPQKAVPTEDVIKMLSKLSKSSSNEVVLISGRDKKTFGEWFKSLKVGLAAEHGAWIKERPGDWKALEQLSDAWKKEILPILETYADRTPGSFVEEKDFSLAWHYRATEPTLGALRAKELKDNILSSISNLNLEVLNGNKVIEIKSSLINKGRAAQNWLSKQPYTFILAIGDDNTDEDLFAALPKEAYSIKVGVTPSKARYSLSSQKEVLPLLWKCIENEKP